MEVKSGNVHNKLGCTYTSVDLRWFCYIHVDSSGFIDFQLGGHTVIYGVERWSLAREWSDGVELGSVVMDWSYEME